jgi:hypothetical protein
VNPHEADWLKRTMRRSVRIIGFVSALGLLAGSAAGQTSLPQVSAFLRNEHLVPAVTAANARTMASAIMRDASVRLEWPTGSLPEQVCDPAPARPVIVVFQHSEHAAPGNNQALAYTYPYAERTPKIVINYDLVGPFGAPASVHTSLLLAHLIAHELTHVLERVSRHSETGLMKAHWTSRDYAEMDRHHLAFAADDLVLISLGLSAWRREACPTDSESIANAKQRNK